MTPKRKKAIIGAVIGLVVVWFGLQSFESRMETCMHGRIDQLNCEEPGSGYSHSIVAGGLELIS